MKAAFFADLAANTKNDQVIVIENDEPSSDIVNKINLVRFTGDPEKARTGFFPPVA